MNNTKRIIAIHIFTFITMMFLGNTNVYASTVTGNLSSSSVGSSSSQDGGTVNGNIEGTGGGGGSGGGGGGSASGGTSSSGSPSSNINQNNFGGGLVFEALTLADIPGLPNTGVGPDNSTITLWSLIILSLGIFITFMVYWVFILKYRKTS